MAIPELRPSAPATPRLAKLLMATTWAAFLALFLVSAWQTGFSVADLTSGTRDFVAFFGKLTPDWRALPEIWGPLLETVQIAYLATIFGTLLGAPLIFLASRNTSVGGPIMWLARGILTILRSIPDLLYAAILAPMLSPGPLPGVLALTLFTMAVLAKLGSETVEAVDPGPLEALRATGAGRNRMIVYGVLPQIAATMTSYILYVFEINIRVSVIIGLVGAGGIGMLLNTYLNFFDYGGLSVLIIIIFAVVLVIDLLSTYLRSRLI